MKLETYSIGHHLLLYRGISEESEVSSKFFENMELEAKTF